jgi:hypothetical protein
MLRLFSECLFCCSPAPRRESGNSNGRPFSCNGKTRAALNPGPDTVPNAIIDGATRPILRSKNCENPTPFLETMTHRLDDVLHRPDVSAAREIASGSDEGAA